MREYNLANEVEMLDVYYGSRNAWRNNDIPLQMDCQISNPSYIVFSWYVNKNDELIEYKRNKIDDYKLGKLITDSNVARRDG